MKTRIRSLVGALALVAALLIPAVPALAQPAITAQLEPVGGSGVRGTLLVEPPVGGISTLVVEPTGLKPGTRYNAFLHAGTCATPSASAARLMGILTVTPDGRGRLMSAHATGGATGVAFELTRELLADGDHLVIVRDEGGTAVACGAIPRAVAVPTQLPRTGGVPTAALGLVGLGLLAAAGLATRGMAARRAG